MPSTLALLLLPACTAPQDEAASFEPTLPVAHCGVAPYDLLPLQGLGQVTDHEIVSGFDLAASAVDSLLSLLGVDALSPVPHGATVFRFEHTTQDLGQPALATGMVAVPSGGSAPPDGQWPVVLMLHGFAGTFDACAPSGDALVGPTLVAVLAAQGLVVIAPDYIGMKGMGAPSTGPHAPLVGEQVAIGAWDAWRAGRSLLEEELANELAHPLRDDVLIWGASQGGHAALFTELAAPHYAPSAEVLAVVASTPAHDLRAIVQDAVTTWSDASGLSALSLSAMWTWYQQPEDLTSLLTNEEPYWLADALAELMASEPDACEAEDVDLDVDEVTDIYDRDFIAAAVDADWEAAGPWGCFVQENSLSATSIPRLSQVPTLLVYGEHDSLIQPPLQAPDLDALCAKGWQAQVLQCQGAPHAEATLWSLPEQLSWMQDRVDGATWNPACDMPAPTCCEGTPTDEDCGD